MIPPEHGALVRAIMSESDADFDQAVEIASNMLRHLREEGYEIKEIDHA